MEQLFLVLTEHKYRYIPSDKVTRENAEMKQYIIDRFEETFAVLECENGMHISIEKSKLPSGCQEGDVVYLGENGYQIDKKETQKRRQTMEQLQKRLFRS